MSGLEVITKQLENKMKDCFHEENIMEIDKIKLHPIEICSEMAYCIAYCIGATYNNVEEIANKNSRRYGT